jgi:hypothetical protein
MQHKTEQRSSKCEDPIVVSQTEQRDNKREDPIVVSPTEIHSKHNVIMYPDATSSSFQQTEFNNRERPNNIFSESFYEDIREEKVHLVLQNGNALISHIAMIKMKESHRNHKHPLKDQLLFLDPSTQS